jgi:hypothetical protein
LEVDPRRRKITWTYEADPPSDLFSPIRGGAQRLPNGNTLITDSERGRVFEVTHDGDIVWDFFNPDVTGKGAEQKRAPIYRMTRYPLGALQAVQDKPQSSKTDKN